VPKKDKNKFKVKIAPTGNSKWTGRKLKRMINHVKRRTTTLSRFGILRVQLGEKTTQRNGRLITNKQRELWMFRI